MKDEGDTVGRGIDRQARDALAEIVAAYLKGEIRSDELDGRLWSNPVIENTGDLGVRLLCDDLWLIHDDLVHPICVSRETWDWLLRVLALLRTDLELTTVGHCAWHRKQLLAAVGLLAIGTGLAISLAWGSWAPFVLTWAAVGTVVFFYSQLRAYSVHPAIEELGQFAPFRNGIQWRTHQHLLDPFDIPPYNPAVDQTIQAGQGGPAAIDRKWFLFGPLYGAVGLPWMLGREKQKIHVTKA